MPAGEVRTPPGNIPCLLWRRGSFVREEESAMGRRTRARQRRYEDAREPFLLREFGGAPGWMLIIALLIVAGIVVAALLNLA